MQGVQPRLAPVRGATSSQLHTRARIKRLHGSSVLTKDVVHNRGSAKGLHLAAPAVPGGARSEGAQGGVAARQGECFCTLFRWGFNATLEVHKDLPPRPLHLPSPARLRQLCACTACTTAHSRALMDVVQAARSSEGDARADHEASAVGCAHCGSKAWAAGVWWQDRGLHQLPWG